MQLALPASGQPLAKAVIKADSLAAASDFAAAQEVYEEALTIATARSQQDTVGLIHLRLGIAFENRSLYSEALDHYFKALGIFEAERLANNLAAASKNIGQVYFKVGNMNSGFAFSRRALDGWRALKDSENIAAMLNDIGIHYMNRDSLALALSYFNQVLSADYRAHIKSELKANALTNIGLVYLSEEKNEEALRYFNEAYPIYQQISARNKIAQGLEYKSEAYLGMKDYTQALQAQRQSLALAQWLDDKDLKFRGYYNLSEIYNQLGDFRKAHDTLMEAMNQQDLIYHFTDSSRFKLSEANYQIDQKAATLENTESQLRQRNWLLLAVTVISVLLVLSIFLLYKGYRNRQRHERLVEKQHSLAMEAQLKESELIALRAQMNPHFIFNALSSIKNYMLEQNVELADYYLGKFAKLIRLILDNSSQPLIPLEKELFLLESYIQLEQLRFENKFSYSIIVDDELSTLEVFIPSMILQPFVENAIIHGFLHKEGSCRLDINIRRKGNVLLVTVEDDGVGRARSAQLRSRTHATAYQSKGYKISEQRLKALSNDMEDAGICFEDLDDEQGRTGTRVQIRIPLPATPPDNA